jgi:putative transposase
VTSALPVLRLGSWVHYNGGEHQVVTLAGTSVGLRSAEGAESVVLASYLMASPGFEISGGDPPRLEPAGLLDGLPPKALAAARELERHVVEALTGFPSGTAPGTAPRRGYDPSATTQLQRDEAKAAELGVTARTVQEYRARWTRQGLLGLIDRRVLRGSSLTGRADARLIAALREALAGGTGSSTRTRAELMRQVVQAVEDAHGPGTVPIPGKTTFYQLVGALSAGRGTFGSPAVVRRQSPAGQAEPITATTATRPGEEVQIGSTRLDVQVLADAGVTVPAELTIAVDVATRTISAAVLRPVGTRAIDAELLLARMLVPEPARPGWAESLRMSASVLPHARLTAIDARMALAAARPLVVPDTIVIDGSRVLVSETFTRACARLGISVQRAQQHTLADRSVVDATCGSVNALFCKYLADQSGSRASLGGALAADDGAWIVSELQELLDEWLIASWQNRPHDALRDPWLPRRVMSPNQRYAALVAAAGYLPVTLAAEDYIELLPVTWRAIRDCGIRIGHRTYDHADLASRRRLHSGITARKGLWEVHYDPYETSRVFVRTPDGWVTAPCREGIRPDSSARKREPGPRRAMCRGWMRPKPAGGYGP